MEPMFCTSLSKSILTILAIMGFSSAQEICGPPSNLRCVDKCRQTCLTQNGTFTDEKRALQRNLCVRHCYGEVYSPNREMKVDEDKLSLPVHNDFQDCLGPCKHPIKEFCQTSYLGMLTYCDCHKCCLNKADKPSQLRCAVGCHQWYAHQWSPKSGEGCTAMTDVKHTPNHWCPSICKWRIYKDYNDESFAYFTDTGDLPHHLQAQEALCVKRCVNLVSAGAIVDADTATTTMCLISPKWYCFEVLIHSLILLTNVTTEKAKYNASSTRVDTISVVTHSKSNRVQTHHWRNIQGINQTFHVVRSAYIESYYNFGINVSLQEDDWILPSTDGYLIQTSPPFIRNTLKDVFIQAYGYPNHKDTVSRTQSFIVSGDIEAGCSTVEYGFDAEMVEDMILKYDLGTMVVAHNQPGHPVIRPRELMQIATSRPEWKGLTPMIYAVTNGTSSVNIYGVAGSFRATFATGAEIKFLKEETTCPTKAIIRQQPKVVEHSSSNFDDIIFFK